MVVIIENKNIRNNKMPEITCSKCHCEFDVDLFYGYNNKILKTCLFCRETNKAYRKSKKKINEPTTAPENESMIDETEPFIHLVPCQVNSTFGGEKIATVKKSILETLNKYYLVMEEECFCEDCLDNDKMDLVYQHNYILITFKEVEQPSGISENIMSFICLKDKKIQRYTLPLINVFDGFTKSIQLKDKKRCQICVERKIRKFVECSRCSNIMCHSCFRNCKNKSCCSYCRYDLLNDYFPDKVNELHIDYMCETLQMKPSFALPLPLLVPRRGTPLDRGGEFTSREPSILFNNFLNQIFFDEM
jgi:hypothetical protein